MEVKVMTHCDIIDTNLTEFKDIHENQLKLKENIAKVKRSGEQLISKKFMLMEKLVQAKKT